MPDASIPRAPSPINAGGHERVSDPARLRALAHPLRIRLFDLLTETDQATATECGAMLGESVASCSFHLRMLEKYGFIERAPSRGREKPWRVTATSWDMRPSANLPESLAAVREIAVLGLDAEWRRIRKYFANIEDEVDEWVQASTFTRATFWATSQELSELSLEIQQLTDRFAGRSEDVASRPQGARPARLVAIANPDPRSPNDRGMSS